MRPAGLEKGVGIISSAFDKDPTDPQWQDTPEYKEWLAWMKKYNPSANIADAIAVDGYGRAQTLVAVLKAFGDNTVMPGSSIGSFRLWMLAATITSPSNGCSYNAACVNAAVGPQIGVNRCVNHNADGFIQPQGGGKDVFVHISAVERAGLSTLNEGQQVQYEEVSNRGKTSAENLNVN